MEFGKGLATGRCHVSQYFVVQRNHHSITEHDAFYIPIHTFLLPVYLVAICAQVNTRSWNFTRQAKAP
jgi:hypothetical protein